MCHDYPHLSHYKLAVRGLGIVTLALEKANLALKDRDIISEETGEIRSSVDALRRLADTQRAILRDLGLQPSTAAEMMRQCPTVEGAFERVRKMHATRHQEPEDVPT